MNSAPQPQLIIDLGRNWLNELVDLKNVSSQIKNYYTHYFNIAETEYLAGRLNSYRYADWMEYPLRYGSWSIVGEVGELQSVIHYARNDHQVARITSKVEQVKGKDLLLAKMRWSTKVSVSVKHRILSQRLENGCVQSYIDLRGGDFPSDEHTVMRIMYINIYTGEGIELSYPILRQIAMDKGLLQDSSNKDEFTSVNITELMNTKHATRLKVSQLCTLS